MRELIHRKDSLVAQRATPAYFMQVPLLRVWGQGLGFWVTLTQKALCCHETLPLADMC